MNNISPRTRHSVPIQYLSEPPTEWITYQPKSKLLVLDRVFEKQGIQIPKLLMVKNIIHLPTVKTHVFTGTTGSMKNAFGGLLNMNRHWTHSVIHETLVDLSGPKEIHPGYSPVTARFPARPRGPARSAARHDYILASTLSHSTPRRRRYGLRSDDRSQFIRLAHENVLAWAVKRSRSCDDIRA